MNKSKLLIVVGLLLLITGLFGGITVAQQIDTGPQPDVPEIHGGLLYDKWWTHLGVEVPTGDHPLWATQSTNTRSGADTWRCKECHGWDYLGADGAYGSGSHLTGFPGVYDARAKSTGDIVAALKGATNPDHDFSQYMSDADLTNLAAFIQGLRDVRQFVDYSAKAPIGGDAANGKVLFESDTGCIRCHGPDGAKINFGDATEPEFVGTIAVDNPQEFMHKAIYGQPAADPRMQGIIELGWSEADLVDIMAYAQTLPTGLAAAEAPPATLPQSGGNPSPLLDISFLLVVAGAFLLGAGIYLNYKKEPAN